jgi:hypothetical protein
MTLGKGTMQYGAVDTENLEPDHSTTNHKDMGIKTYRNDVKPDGIHRCIPSTVDKFKTTKSSFERRRIRQTNARGVTDKLNLDKIFNHLYDGAERDLKNTQEQGLTNNRNPSDGKLRREIMSPERTAELKSQTRIIQSLCYDTTGTLGVLRALQNTDQDGSWYHTTAEQAKSILRFRQADAYKLKERGMDASRGVVRKKDGAWRTVDEVWEDMKIHVRKTKRALEATNEILQLYPPHGKLTTGRTGRRTWSVDTKPELPELVAFTALQWPTSNNTVWQRPNEYEVKSKQNTSEHSISTTSDANKATRCPRTLRKKTEVVEIRMDGEFTEVKFTVTDDEHRCTLPECDHTFGCKGGYLRQKSDEPKVSSQLQSDPKQDDCELILHVGNNDLINTEGESGTDRTTQRGVGVVVANVRQKKTEVTAIEGQITGDPRNNGKVKPKGNTQYEKPSITKSKAGNERPEKLVEVDGEEEKNTHSSRQHHKPRGCIETWSLNSKAWYYTIDGESIWGSDAEGIKRLFEKGTHKTDTEGKSSSGSGIRGAKESTAKAIAGPPIRKEENRRAGNAEIEKTSEGARKVQKENEVVGGPQGSEKERSLALKLRRKCEEYLQKTGIEEGPRGATDIKEKVMRGQSRSPERSRDKTRRAKSETRWGSHERRREDRSRSKSPERGESGLKHRARHKERNPDKEEVVAKSVSSRRQEISWENPHKPRQRAETVGGATRREHVSRCGRCSTYKGVTIRNTHENETCHAATLICHHCQKPSIILLG